jgi:SAM-dependent methyltransferase
LSRYRGGFPLFFEPNLIKLLGYPEQILQPFGGRAEYGMRLDLDPLTEPDIVADAHDLPLPDDSFDLVLLDPPYSQEEALDLYGITRKLEPGKYLREAVRVTKPGGWVVVYGDKEPRRPPRTNHTLRIMVVLRPGHSPRTCVVFQKRKVGMPFYGSEPGEQGYDPTLHTARRRASNPSQMNVQDS